MALEWLFRTLCVCDWDRLSREAGRRAAHTCWLGLTAYTAHTDVYSIMDDLQHTHTLHKASMYRTYQPVLNGQLYT